MNRFQKKEIILHNILSSSLTIILLINFVSFVQRAKKVVPDSPGLMDFAIGPVVFVLNLPKWESAVFWGNSNYRRTVINPVNQKEFWAS